MSDINPRTGEPYRASKAARKKMHWSPEKRAKFNATLEAKGLHVLPGGSNTPEARKAQRERAKAKKGSKPKAAKKPSKWTPEFKREYNRAYHKKKAAERAQARQQGAAQEFPLDAIPERPTRAAVRKPKAVNNDLLNGHAKALADKVYAEYDVTLDRMTLVMGKLRLALRVKA
jgi:hypothetical protein